MSLELDVKSAVRWILLSLALILTGILVAGGVILYGEYSETHWVPPAGWVNLALFTALVFGASISEFSRSWRSIRFWAAITGLVVSHVLAHAVLFDLTPEWPPIYFALITMVEVPFLNYVLFAAGFPIAPLTRRGDRPAATRNRHRPRSMTCIDCDKHRDLQTGVQRAAHR